MNKKEQLINKIKLINDKIKENKIEIDRLNNIDYINELDILHQNKIKLEKNINHEYKYQFEISSKKNKLEKKNQIEKEIIIYNKEIERYNLKNNELNNSYSNLKNKNKENVKILFYYSKTQP